MPIRASVVHFLMIISTACCLAEESLPALHWTPETQRLLVAGATYGRMKSLPGGGIVCSYEKTAKSWVMRSEDGGQSWSAGVLAGAVEDGIAANPEMCMLARGTLLCFFNERPRTQGKTRKFSIRMSRSDDEGRTWTPRDKPIFEGGNTMADGCWEPAAIEMPDGEIRLFFARELPGQQEIALMTSRDAGATWSPPTQVSLRPKHRDGMPVPCLLKDGRLVFSVEDNGIAGQDRPHPPFRPSIIDYAHQDRWVALPSPPPDRSNVAAPYLTRLPTGETLLSVQTNVEDTRWHRMAVFVGDAHAKGFTNRTLPFGLPPESNAQWNSLFVKDERTVFALTNASIEGQRGLWCVEGKVKRGSDPFVGSVPSGGVVPKMEVKEQTKHPQPDRDKFGGFVGIQTRASGFFRVEQLKGRWFFITPQGHPFIAIGANHTGPTIRHQDTGLWKRWNNSPDETAKNMLPIIQGMGFTAGDVYQPESTYTRTLPWISFFWYGETNHTFIDVFDDTTMADVTRRAFEHAKSLADNPWVLGIGGPDLSIWDEKLVRKYRELKPGTPGRQKYSDFISDRYQGDITAFNTVYGTNFVSFQDLATQETLRYPEDAENDQVDPMTLRWRLPVPADQAANPAIVRDNDAFCAVIASTLFPQVREAVKRGAPNHLFLGEHLAVRMIPDAVIMAMAPHVDAYLAQAVEVSPQRPPEWQVFQKERWDHEYALLKKPVVIVDWGAVFSLGKPFEFKGATIKPEKEASDEAAQFVLHAFHRPYIVGLFLCKLWGEHKNDANFFQNRATRTYLKPDATPWPYRTEALRRANFEAQRQVFDRLSKP